MQMPQRALQEQKHFEMCRVSHGITSAENGQNAIPRYFALTSNRKTHCRLLSKKKKNQSFICLIENEERFG